MKSNKQNQVRLSEEILNNQLIAKKLVKQERDINRKKAKKIIDVLKKGNVSEIFESEKTILTEQGNYSPKVDFAYFKLNIEYLKKQGLNLKFLEASLLISKTHKEIEYIEYYLNEEKTYMIFVKYKFKHIRICSETKKTDLNTFVFINSSSEIYYHDEYIQNKLINRFDTNMDVNCAKEIFKNKKFKVMPLKRAYKIITSRGEELQEKDMHLIYKHLLDSFLEKYKNSLIPYRNEVKVESNFLGTIQENVAVQSKVVIDHENFGIIENYENILGYEIVLSLSDMPNKKVTAQIYLTESEYNGHITISEKYLEEAILESDDKKIEKEPKQADLIFFKRVINSKCALFKHEIYNYILQYLNIESYSCENPVLKGTFKKIYLEFFKVNTKNSEEKYTLKQIKTDIIEYEEGIFSQSSMYYMNYGNKVYLLEICAIYEAYIYNSYLYNVNIPAFGISDIQVKIIKPIAPNEIDKFVNREKIKDISRVKIKDICVDIETYRYYTSKEEIKSIKRNLKNIFPDFVITNLDERCENNYKIAGINDEEIYKNILKCIQKNENGIFKCVGNSIYFEDDEDDRTKKVPIYTNNVMYGYYKDDECNKRYVKLLFRDNKGNVEKNYETLMEIEFEEDSCFYKTTFYSLIDSGLDDFNYHCKIERKKFNLAEDEFYKLCIDFLLERQEEIFSN